jgi:hypothetical protein
MSLGVPASQCVRLIVLWLWMWRESGAPPASQAAVSGTSSSGQAWKPGLQAVVGRTTILHSLQGSQGSSLAEACIILFVYVYDPLHSLTSNSNDAYPFAHSYRHDISPRMRFCEDTIATMRDPPNRIAMNAPTKRSRPAGRTFYTTVLALSILATLSFLNRQRGGLDSPQLVGRSLTRRDQEVR